MGVDLMRWEEQQRPLVIKAQAEEIARLKTDNERLRALVRAAEWAAPDSGYGGGACPWCREDRMPYTKPHDHAEDCPAFDSTRGTTR